MPHQYSPADEGTHQPGADRWWQESVFVHWYDPKAEVGGIHRIGHEPNYDGGCSALQCMVFDGKGARFRRVGQLPLTPPSTPRGFRAGGSSWHVDDGRVRLEVREPGCDVDLEMVEFYPLTDFFPPSGSMVDEFAKNHYETSGRIIGRVHLDGTWHEIDGLYHRDHSWGIRRWDTLLSHRWVSGTFGPHLSFGSINWHAVDDTFIQVGYVVRNGEITIAEKVDVVTWMEADGITHRGGEVTWHLPGGQRLALTARQVDAVVTEHHGVVYVDSTCVVEHEGQVGMCDFEISTNPRNGARPVTFALGANLTDGLSRRS